MKEKSAKPRLLIVSPPSFKSSHSMKIYKRHLIDVAKEDYYVDSYKWELIDSSQTSIKYRFNKYCKSRYNLNKYGSPNIQHVTDQSFAHLYNKNANLNILTIHDVIPIIAYKNKLLKKRSRPPLFFNYVSYFFKKFDKIITPSITTKMYLLDLFKMSEESVIVVNNAVEGDLVIEEKFSGIHVLMIGDTFYKNSQNAIEAIDLFSKSEGIKIKIHWVVNSRDYSETIKEIFAKNKHLEIKTYINLTRLEILNLFRCCSVLLFPSLLEGFGFPIIEAMRNRLPVITTKYGATFEVASNHCFLVEPSSAESISKGLNDFYNIDGEVLDEMLEKAYLHSLEFNLNRFKEEILSVYKDQSIY